MVVGCQDRRLAAAHAGSAQIDRLRAQPLNLEQSSYVALAKALTQVTHVQCELTTAVHAAALQPRVLEQVQKPLIILGARGRMLGLPGTGT